MSKKALCIGINDYQDPGSNLTGCVNDANNWKAALEQRGFTVRQLLNSKATKDAMYRGIRQLVEEAQRGDTVVITYSGHGSWIPDHDGDEIDGRDEVLCPYDIAQNRPLTDDELYNLFEERQPGVRIVFIADSCHSGSVIRVAPAPAEATGYRYRFLAPERFLPTERLAVAERRARRVPAGIPRPFGGLLLSGCQDWEYSFDAVFNRRPNGAFTYFALKALDALPQNATCGDWYKVIRESLPSEFHPQTPRLQGSQSQRAWHIFD
jgi:hypothetical protein